ncbi:MAG: NUDIX hydrolase [bacterium]|nr:NUDIX hydrolase [bacterium]
MDFKVITEEEVVARVTETARRAGLTLEEFVAEGRAGTLIDGDCRDDWLIYGDLISPEALRRGRRRDFAVTVDIVLLTVVKRSLEVLLVRRGKPPYEGAWALPGGFVEPDEDLPEAAARELLEETGIGVAADSLQQVGAYGHPDRDPRMRVVTVAYRAVVAQLAQTPQGGDDAAHAGLVPMAEVRSGRVTLAFDHRQIVEDAVSRLWSDPDCSQPPAGD